MSFSDSRLGRWLRATALTGLFVPLLVVVGGAPAHAAACEQGTGVTVVVQGQDMNAVTCVPGGGRTAAAAFQAAGYSLTPYKGPGGSGDTVCQINGVPSQSECWKQDSFWGLFHADGNGGAWVFASQGAYSLSIPTGGWVAFKFQGASTSYPSVTPVGPAPQPTGPPPTQATTKPKPNGSTNSNNSSNKPSGNKTSGTNSSKKNSNSSKRSNSSDSGDRSEDAGSTDESDDGSVKGSDKKPKKSKSGKSGDDDTVAGPDALTDEELASGELGKFTPNESNRGSLVWTGVGLLALVGVGTVLVLRRRRA